MIITFPGTQQELRKLSVSESQMAPKSIQEALDQLHDTVEMIGADKKQVCKWVMNIFGLVRHSFTYVLKTFSSLHLLDERKTHFLLKTF